MTLGPSALASEYTPFVDDGYEISGGVSGGGEFNIYVDTAPFIYDGRTFLPIRFVAEAFGILTTWDGNATRTATLERGTTTVQLTVGSKTMILIKNGIRSSIEMDVAPMMWEGRVCMPVRFVAEAFGLGVEWLTLYDEENGKKTNPRSMVEITEREKILTLTIGNAELAVVGGYFLKNYESQDFRFAYPRLPETENNNIQASITIVENDLPEGLSLTFYHTHWARPDRIITVTYTPSSEGTPLGLLPNLEDAQVKTEVHTEDANVNDIPAVAYTIAPLDDGELRGTCGVAFYHNKMLMRIEVSSYYSGESGTMSSEQGIHHSKVLLDELLSTLTMKKR